MGQHFQYWVTLHDNTIELKSPYTYIFGEGGCNRSIIRLANSTTIPHIILENCGNTSMHHFIQRKDFEYYGIKDSTRYGMLESRVRGLGILRVYSSIPVGRKFPFPFPHNSHKIPAELPQEKRNPLPTATLAPTHAYILSLKINCK